MHLQAHKVGVISYNTLSLKYITECNEQDLTNKHTNIMLEKSNPNYPKCSGRHKKLPVYGAKDSQKITIEKWQLVFSLLLFLLNVKQVFYLLTPMNISIMPC